MFIGSPMSALQMESASDDAILNLFAELHDEADWRHPRREMTGEYRSLSTTC